jgi:hypothetical protein
MGRLAFSSNQLNTTDLNSQRSPQKTSRPASRAVSKNSSSAVNRQGIVKSNTLPMSRHSKALYPMGKPQQGSPKRTSRIVTSSVRGLSPYTYSTSKVITGEQKRPISPIPIIGTNSSARIPGTHYTKNPQIAVRVSTPVLQTRLLPT